MILRINDRFINLDNCEQIIIERAVLSAQNSVPFQRIFCFASGEKYTYLAKSMSEELGIDEILLTWYRRENLI